MAELTKNLHFLKNGIEQTAKIYTTASEAGNNYISVKVDGTTGYVPIGETSHENATMGRVTKGNSTYAILSSFTKKLSYVGAITALSKSRRHLAATTVGNYALFGGGSNATTDAYNTSLTRTTPTALSEFREALVATTVGNYALFGGGSVMRMMNGRPYPDLKNTVDAYNTSLTRTTPTALSVARHRLTATTVGNYALFGSGSNGKSFQNTVDAYNTSLTRTTPTALSVARECLAATTVGNYALFGGGGSISDTNTYATVDAYNTSLTRTTPTALSAARKYLAATTVGNYALFGGGDNGKNCLNTVDVYNTSLTRTTSTALSVARYILAATTVGNYALFGGGGLINSTNTYATVDAYTVS